MRFWALLEEAAGEGRWPRSEPTGGGVRLLEEPLLAVRIPRFQARGALGAHVAYAIVVEQPGATSTVEKRYSEFCQLHDELAKKPFAPTLCSLPDWRALANFSPQFLERRRQQLEAYLSFLCLHTLVLLDGAIWRWLALELVTQVTVQMATAHVLCDAPRVAAGIRDLEALLAVGQPAEGCAHPLVLGALRAALADPGVPDEVPTRACRVLERVLTLPRARLLFLPRKAGGVAALLAVHGRGGAAAEAARAVFEALCDADTGPDASAAEGAGPAGQRPSPVETELGECVICLDRERSRAFLPCGHLCACADCATFMSARGDKCPICRRQIQRAVQIFV